MHKQKIHHTQTTQARESQKLSPQSLRPADKSNFLNVRVMHSFSFSVWNDNVQEQNRENDIWPPISWMLTSFPCLFESGLQYKARMWQGSWTNKEFLCCHGNDANRAEHMPKEVAINQNWSILFSFQAKVTQTGWKVLQREANYHFFQGNALICWLFSLLVTLLRSERL